MTLRACEMFKKTIEKDPRMQGKSQEAQGKILGISQSQVSLLFNPEKNPGREVGIDVLLALRAYTGHSIDDLLGLPPLQSEIRRLIEAAGLESQKRAETGLPAVGILPGRPQRKGKRSKSHVRATDWVPDETPNRPRKKGVSA